MSEHRIFTAGFGSVYPLYVQKAERKGRTREEVNEIICWLTGYRPEELEKQIGENVDFRTFFAQAPQINPAAGEMKGSICGVRLETIEDPLMRNIRCLDKLIDDLAKGKTMDKILGRKPAVSQKVYEYDAVIHSVPDQDGAYVAFPWDIRQEFGRGRVKVHAAFDGIPYDGSVVNMGVTNEDGTVCYIIGITKGIRKKLKKGAGDTVHVTVRERE